MPNEAAVPLMCIQGRNEMTADSDLLTATLTRKQWQEIRKALISRRSLLNKGIREGTATVQDRMMADAIIDQINVMLRSQDLPEQGR